MNRGERALIDSDIRHCYGDMGCEEKQIPSINSTKNSYKMKIDLEFHDWKSPPDVQTLSIEDRLFWGDKKRQMGNFYYRRQDYPTSLQCYRGALRFLDTENNSILTPFDESQRSILNDRYIQVQNNVAQVNLLLNKYEACLIAVENVLKHDSKNVKALFRQGKALFELGKYDQAIQPLKLFSQLQRGNSAAAVDYDKVTEMITVCENKLANYQKNEKEIYRRMFQPQPTTTTSALNQQRSTKNNKQVRISFV
jgi:tetratricopeptide (TPR) repeat protein